LRQRWYRRVSRGVERLEARLALSVSVLPAPGTPPTATFSTVPANGDVNPYGISIVPSSFPTAGVLNPGDVLVTNFNGATTGQGTGTTIVRITPSNTSTPPATFFTSTLQGTTTPPVIFKAGFVAVGNVPAGPNGTIGQGAVQIIDSSGNLVATLSDPNLLPDPWNLAVNDLGKSVQLFVSNVSGKTGSHGIVTRVDISIVKGKPVVQDMVEIASGYRTRLDSAALVVGPGGLAYDAQSGTLYVAVEDQKVQGKEVGTIFAIPNAATTNSDGGLGNVVYADAAHLRGPMGLALAPNGDLVTANSDAVHGDPTQPSELVEFTKSGTFVSQFSVDSSQGGAFALTFGPIAGNFSLAAVDDNTNTLDVWTVPASAARAASAVVTMGGSANGASKHTAAIDAVTASLLQHNA
jgi:hypothetical protein